MGWGCHVARTSRIVAVWLALAFCGLVAACQPAADSTTDPLILWHGYRGEEQAQLLAAIERWNETKPTDMPAVRATAVPGEALPDKLSASVPRGRGPDLFLFAHDRMGGWVEAGGMLEPLDFWLTDDLKQAYLPGLFDAVSYRGAVYALPLNFKTLALIYNKELVDTPPTTTLELRELAEARTNAARGQFGLVYAYDEPFFYGPMINGFSGGIFDDQAEPLLASDGAVAAGELLSRWRQSVLPSDPTPSLMDALFNDGRAAFIINGPWFLGQINPKIDYGVSVLPRLSEANGEPMRPWLSVEAVYIAAGKPRAREAFEFATFLTGAEGAAIMAEGGQTPANAAIYNTPALANDPIVQAFRDQAANGVPTPNIPEMTLVWTPLEKAMRRIIKSEATPQAAMADLQREVTGLIAQLRATSEDGA